MPKVPATVDVAESVEERTEREQGQRLMAAAVDAAYAPDADPRPMPERRADESDGARVDG